jgi:hypothetical protein
MSIHKKPWPIKTTHGIRDRIDTNPDYQRPAVWGKAQKQLLIDTILREYDVPKLYWRKTATKPDKYDVVDGQQRLRSIWEYINGDFSLPKNADPIDGEDVANCKYENLPDDLRMHFDVYPLDVVIIENIDEDEVREMFLRLQNGTSLKAQEKRNAYSGRMRDFVKDIAEHSFFNSVGFKNSRYTYDLVAAQLVCLEIASEPTNVKNADLNKMYEENKDFNEKSEIAKRVKKVLNCLMEIFPQKTPELTRYNVITLYCVVSSIMEQFVIVEIKNVLHDWFLDFEKTRKEEEAKGEDEASPEWVSYKEKISHSTDASDSIKFRLDYLLRDILRKNPKLSRKDNQREFNHAQKMVVYRRDEGKCQLKLKCSGEKLGWDNWQCDHIKPWSRGGLTVVDNGQVSCPTCNGSKGADVLS